MKKFHAFFLATLLAAGASTLRAQDAVYEIDPVHSTVLAHVVHLGASTVWVRFNGPTGTVTFNEADPSKSAITLEIKSDSLDSANEKRDQHLKSPDFLNAKEFPAITFKSTAVKKTGDKTYEATGNLTVHGVTKPITATITAVGTGKGAKGETRAGADAKFTIKRGDFGVGATFPATAISEDIGVEVSLEAIKK
jgi:polyisoprenoid-binding protein YceI